MIFDCRRVTGVGRASGEGGGAGAGVEEVGMVGPVTPIIVDSDLRQVEEGIQWHEPP